MTSRGQLATRRRPCLAAAIILASLLALAALASGARGASRGLALSIRGRHLIGAHHHATRLLGVNRSGTEYACAEGWGIFDSPHPARPDGAAMIRAMRSWRVNAVRVPLNEACWLGINGVSSSYSRRPYRRAIVTYVHRLEQAHIHPILDLHVADPGRFAASSDLNGLRPMPDAAHSLPFWRSLAKRFGRDRAVVFDLYNEPNSISWRCLRDGCRITRDAYDSSVPDYRAVGTQRLVNAIRRHGAKNVIMVPGIGWTGDLGRWLRWRPDDSLHRIAASFHNYEGPYLGTCHLTCWRQTIAPIARRFPVATGEMGDVDCNHDYIDQYMDWADAHGVSYLGWTWDATAPGGWTCDGGPSLITDYSGSPTGYGVGLRDHLRAIRGG